MVDEPQGKEGQIRIQLESLDRATQALSGVIDRVEDRLISVLVPPKVTVNEVEKIEKPKESLVPLASSIREFVELAKYQSDRLMDILSRIEL